MMGKAEAFAHTLSSLTIISCMFMKVPQIQQIRRTRNTSGLYLQAMIMEILGYTIMTLYNYTNNYGILTYMEYPIILLQVYCLLYYVLKFRNKLYTTKVTMATLAYCITTASFATNILPKKLLDYIVPFCTPLSGFAKVTYIYGIIVNSNADAVSLVTWTISIATNLARVYTVYMDSGDIKLMGNFIISAFLSAGVMLTAFVYKLQPEPRRCDIMDLPRSRRKSTHYD